MLRPLKILGPKKGVVMQWYTQAGNIITNIKVKIDFTLTENHYSHILHVCMNTRKGKEKFKNFQILLNSGCSSTIVM